MKKKDKPKTIGQITNSRANWGINTLTRIVENKKGKGSYKRTRREGKYYE